MLLLSPSLDPPPPRRWLRIAPPAIVFVTTIYLNLHSFTDSLACLVIGVFLDRVLTRIPWACPTKQR